MFVLLTGDIGGTHGRVQLWQCGAAFETIVELASVDLRPSDFGSLKDLISAALVDACSRLALVEPVVPSRGILAVCGPVWDHGRKNESNNIAEWIAEGSTMAVSDAADIESAIGMSAGSLKMLNDFEAVGYAIAALLDPSAPQASVPTPPTTLHASASVVDGQSPACCVGAGTGLGACSIVRLPPPVNSFFVLPSEAGMTNSICPQNDIEWRLLQWLRRRPGADPVYVEVECAVSGPGIAAIFDFLVSEVDVPGALCSSRLSPRAEELLSVAAPADRTAAIAELASGVEPEPMCLAAVDLFLTLYGRFCQAAASVFLPYKGLFLAGGVLPKLSWRLAGGTCGAGSDINPLVAAYLAAGPHMTSTIARVPLLLLDDPSLGAKGCLYYAVRGPGA